MKAALFSIVPYERPVAHKGWPVAAADYDAETAQASMRRALDFFELADEVGFDWVSVAEHHYAPGSLTPNPMVMAAAVAERVKRARIALLGSNIPIQNPVRVAEEFAMLDTLTGGRVIAGMLRGTSNEYVTYGVNPAESRERFTEALALIVRAWTEPQPFGWLGRYYEYRTISIWPRPVQEPHPPIFMSISSPEMAEFAAAHRISAGLAVTTVPRAKESLRVYREAAARHGWEPSGTTRSSTARRPTWPTATTGGGASAQDHLPTNWPRPPVPPSQGVTRDANGQLSFYGFDWRVSGIAHCYMNTAQAISMGASTHSSTKRFVPYEWPCSCDVPAPKGHVVHRSLPCCRNDCGKRLRQRPEHRVNQPLRCFDVSARDC